MATQQFLELVDFLKAKGDSRDPVDMVSIAIDYWLENASRKPELLEESDSRGYQWKSLFLPTGTELRMQYKGRYFYANVVGDEMIFEGNVTSPGSLANAIAGSSRNAWHDIWIKRPTETEWTLADDCRRGKRDQVSALSEILKNVESDFNPME